MDRNGMITRRKATALLATATLTTGRFGAAHAQQSTIKIGLATDLTGVAASYARNQVNAVGLAIADVNAVGGIMGRNLELIVRDSQLQPELGASLVRDLITREKVDFLIGPDASSVAVAATMIAKEYKKIMMETIANTPRLVGELFHPYFFTVVPSGEMSARATAEGLDRKYKQIAFIGGDYEASHQAVKYFGDWLGKVNPGAQVINTQWPKLGESDFTPYITELLASKPDMVFSYLWGSDLIAFIKQAQGYRFFDRTKFATLLFLDDLRSLGDQMPDGIIGQMDAPPFATKTARMDAFVQKYNAKYNLYPDDWAVLGYDGMMILAQGIREANSLDSDTVVKALEATRYEGLQGGVTSFRAVDHQANSPVFIGVTAEDHTLPFKTLRNIKRIEAASVWPTPQEILAERT
jgi:branched-chain amino acid transport system substrate-binding protein